MGRYYSGSIRGKFWFGLQSSSAADRFGVLGSYLDDNSKGNKEFYMGNAVKFI
jgi:hypothetical protein